MLPLFPAHVTQHRSMKFKSLIVRGASITGVLAALAATSHLMPAIVAGAALLALLVFFGIAFPAVWSSKPARRKAAAAVLAQILATLRRHSGP